MAQPQPNEFTEIAFSEGEQDAVFASFTDQQLQVLQNFRAAAARYNISRIFADESKLQTELREHAYQLGRMDLISEIVGEVAAARQRTSEESGNSNSTS